MTTVSPLERVKFIDDNTKIIVNGYINRVQKMLTSDNVYFTIPSLVIYWCLLYFYIPEKFDGDDTAQSYALSMDDMMITKIKPDYGTAYLSKIVDVGVHEWTFKLSKMDYRSCWRQAEIYMPRTKRKSFLSCRY